MFQNPNTNWFPGLYWKIQSPSFQVQPDAGNKGFVFSGTDLKIGYYRLYWPPDYKTIKQNIILVSQELLFLAKTWASFSWTNVRMALGIECCKDEPIERSSLFSDCYPGTVGNSYRPQPRLFVEITSGDNCYQIWLDAWLCYVAMSMFLLENGRRRDIQPNLIGSRNIYPFC